MLLLTLIDCNCFMTWLLSRLVTVFFFQIISACFGLHVALLLHAGFFLNCMGVFCLGCSLRALLGVFSVASLPDLSTCFPRVCLLPAAFQEPANNLQENPRERDPS